VKDIRIVWTVSDESIVKMADSDGTFEALASGKVTIKAEEVYSEKTALFVLEVLTVEVKSVALELPGGSFEVGDTVSCAIEILPANATDQAYMLTSSDPEVLRITGDFSAECLKAGAATITVEAANGKKAAVALSVVAVEVESLALELSSDSLKIGDSAVCSVKLSPANSTDHSYTITSSNPEVLQVIGDALNCLKEGVATLTVESPNGKSAAITVAVEAVAAESITLELSSGSFKIGDVAIYTVKIFPDNATDKSYTITSSDPEVVQVIGDSIKCLQEGTAIITATAANGEKASVAATVEKVNVFAIICGLLLIAGFAAIGVFSFKKKKERQAEIARQQSELAQRILDEKDKTKRSEMMLQIINADDRARLQQTLDERDKQELAQQILDEADKKKQKDLMQQMKDRNMRKDLKRQLKDKEEAEKAIAANEKKAKQMEQMQRIKGFMPKISKKSEHKEDTP